MSRELRQVVRALRWPYALVLALAACASTHSAPSDGAARETCAAACARRQAAGCLEPRLAAACVATCEHARHAGVYAPERCGR